MTQENENPSTHPVRAAVIGWPVTHSRSPLIHNYWLEKHGVNARYVAEPVEPVKLESYLRTLHARGLKGCNITVPHKEAALAYVDTLDPLAQRVGAINTVVVHENGLLEGRNTDVYGFAENLNSLKAGGKRWNKRKPALVIGAGGAARAIIVALLDVGVPEIRIANRTSDRARTLVKEMVERGSGVNTKPQPVLRNIFSFLGSKNTALSERLKIIGWPDREDALHDIGLLVNTTTQGMEGQDKLDVSLRHLAPGAVVTDLVYTPLLTPLLLEAQWRNYAFVDGLGMLLHQAAPAFEAWFGVRPHVTPELRRIVEESMVKA